ncbi:Retrovirus-related Pol polyprotein [Stylophora pistillata]|uniref:Retrovirus-related Pol polyprotein n=1 Tax=Stylophora pistillata TaxID=50429 RepID=A0A2B4RD05_STYPI|nr:Retrovirus-related Pol polyprotein [Stylophora pistillata]
MKDKAVFAEMLVKQKPVRFQVDCGASANILPHKHVENVHLAPCSQSLVMWNGTKVKPVGTCALPVVNPRNNIKYKVRFLVVKENLTPLLGLNATEKMSLLTVHKASFVWVVENLENDLVIKYADVFDEGLGKLPGKALNAALKRERYQIPVIDDLLPDLAEARVFSKVDLASDFWHLVLDDESSLLTTFATPHGRYRWLRLLFGLCVSKDVSRLNGTLNYLNCFLPNLSDVMKPLRDLTHKDVEWCWSNVQEKAWNELKSLIASTPVLSYYKPDELLEVQCDSSQAGLGAALMEAFARHDNSLQKYDLEVKYQKGDTMFLADTLSRALFPAGQQDDSEFETTNMIKYLPVPEERLQQIQHYTESDESLQVLKTVIQKGWPEHKMNVPVIISPYFNMRDEMSIQDGLIFKCFKKRAVETNSQFTLWGQRLSKQST